MTGAYKMFKEEEHGSVSEDPAPQVLKIGDQMTIITHTKSQERRHMPITLVQGKQRQENSRTHLPVLASLI